MWGGISHSQGASRSQPKLTGTALFSIGISRTLRRQSRSQIFCRVPVVWEERGRFVGGDIWRRSAENELRFWKICSGCGRLASGVPPARTVRGVSGVRWMRPMLSAHGTRSATATARPAPSPPSRFVTVTPEAAPSGLLPVTVTPRQSWPGSHSLTSMPRPVRQHHRQRHDGFSRRTWPAVAPS